MEQKKVYSTSTFEVACALIASGLSDYSDEKIKGKFWKWTFHDGEQAEKIAEQFLRGELVGDLNKFYRINKLLKAKVKT